jgi:hypothetical protein
VQTSRGESRLLGRTKKAWQYAHVRNSLRERLARQARVQQRRHPYGNPIGAGRQRPVETTRKQKRMVPQRIVRRRRDQKAVGMQIRRNLFCDSIYRRFDQVQHTVGDDRGKSPSVPSEIITEFETDRGVARARHLNIGR